MAISQTRLGILGGTFDPIHIGHLLGALCVRQALKLDRVLLMVAPNPWQKVHERELAPAEMRFQAAAAAATDLPGIEASRLEIDRGGLTYTVDTLKELRLLEPQARLFLIVGADAAAGLDSWKDPEGVAELAEVIVMNRPLEKRPKLADGWRVHEVEIPPLELSSSELRERLRAGLPVDFLIPKPALDLIVANHLYSGVQERESSSDLRVRDPRSSQKGANSE